MGAKSKGSYLYLCTLLSVSNGIVSLSPVWLVGSNFDPRLLYTPQNKKILTLIVAILTVSHLAIGLFDFLVIRAQYRPLPIKDTKVRLDSPDDLYKDVAERVVPDLRQFFRRHPPEKTAYRLPADESLLNRSCLQPWKSYLQSTAAETDPTVVSNIVSQLALDKIKQVSELLKPLLTSPQPLSHLLNKSATCMERNQPMVALACRVQQDGLTMSTLFGSLGEVSQKKAIVGALNFAAVLEAITTATDEDPWLGLEIAQEIHKRATPRVIDYANSVGGATGSFVYEKYVGVWWQAVLAFRHRQTKDVSDVSAWRSPVPMQLNIFEAAHHDLTNGRYDNVFVGLALAASVHSAAAIVDYKDVWGLGADWVDAYTAWDAAVVTVLSDDDVTLFPKLFLPSVICHNQEKHAEGYTSSRIISLLLTLVFQSQSTHEGSVPAFSENLSHLFGTLNRQFAVVSEPTSNTLEDMFNRVCNEHLCEDWQWSMTSASATMQMSSQDFRRFTAILTWITMLLMGLGSEFLVGSVLLHSNASMPRLSFWWSYAQFLFPLFAIIAFGSAAEGSWTCLIFAILALWKGGFPDTVGSFASSLSGQRHEWIYFLCGFGTLLHHSSAALLIASLVTGAAENRQYMTACIWPLVMQHWFVLLKYNRPWTYIVIVLGLEAYFEIQILSSLERVYQNDDWIVTQCALGMLVAHWLFLAHGGCQLVAHGFKPHFSPYIDDQTTGLPSEQARRDTASTHMDASTEHVFMQQHSLTLSRWQRSFRTSVRHLEFEHEAPSSTPELTSSMMMDSFVDDMFALREQRSK